MVIIIVVIVTIIGIALPSKCVVFLLFTYKKEDYLSFRCFTRRECLVYDTLNNAINPINNNHVWPSCYRIALKVSLSIHDFDMVPFIEQQARNFHYSLSYILAYGKYSMYEI